MSEPTILLQTTPITPEIMVTAHINRPDNPTDQPGSQPGPIPRPEQDPTPGPIPRPDQNPTPVPSPEDSDIPPEIIALRERKEEVGRFARELCKDHYEEEFLNIFDALEKRTDILRKVNLV